LPNRESVSRILRRIDGRGYKAYKELLGASEAVDGILLRVTRVQGDPFAPPSVVEARFTVRVGEWALSGDRVIAVADLFHRLLEPALRRHSLAGAGEGGSGRLSVPRPSPIMIPRSTVEVRRAGGGVAEFTVRVWVGLPSRRRRVLGDVAEELILARLPRALREAARGLEGERLRRHVEAWIEQEYLRSELPRLGLVAFVGDGSILPRRCGGCWEPLDGAVPFESPRSLRVEVELPTGRVVSGMGVPRGLSVIAGPAFHGKTTLAEAISHGVWNHIPGDGRELVVTDHTAFYVSSENGRWVSCVDVSSLILSLPGERNTECFSTEDASGATSLAASIQEAVEAGARLLVIDEDEAASYP
jgi:predicted ABC-class ATPase